MTDAELIEYMPMADAYARMIKARVPYGMIDLDDLKQQGYLALVGAAQRYDPAHGVDFRCFARRRIWGAMMDYLRGANMVIPSYRKRVHGEDSPAQMWSLDLLLEAEPWMEPAAAAEIDTAERDELRAKVMALPPKLRDVIERCFFEGEMQSTVADEMGVNPSYVNKLKNKGLKILRRQYV